MPHAYADQSIVDTVSKAATDVANDPATSGAAASAGADVVYSDTLPAQQGSADPAEPSQAAQVCCAVRHHAMLCSVGSRYAVQHGITLCCAVWHHAMLCGVASRYAVQSGITLCCNTGITGFNVASNHDWASMTYEASNCIGVLCYSTCTLAFFRLHRFPSLTLLLHMLWSYATSL